MVILDANRCARRVPRLAGWSLGVGIVATVGANLAHGLGHGPIGALVSAWPALALVGSYELLMTLVKAEHGAAVGRALEQAESHVVPVEEPGTQPGFNEVQILEQAVRVRYDAGESQRAIARNLNIDRRKVKRIVEKPA